jgi:hypothetical protein
MSKRTLAIVATVVALLACAAVATAALSIGGKDTVGTVVDPATQSQAAQDVYAQLTPDGSGQPTAVPAATKAAFGVFRRSQTASDRLAGDAPERLARQGANADLARLVIAGDRSRADAADYYAVPSRGGQVCFVDGTASGGCTTIEEGRVNGTFGSNECVMQAGTAFITFHGLAPDGVDKVTLASPNGDEQDVAVTDNGWYAQAHQFPAASRPQNLKWTDASGTAHSMPLPVSPDVNKGC